MNSIFVKKILAGAIFLGGLHSAMATYVNVWPQERLQMIEGFGGAATYAEGKFTSSTGNALTTALFDPNHLNISFLRVANWHSHTSWGWQDASIAVMKAFRDKQPDGRIIMTAWSPPASLTTITYPDGHIGGTLAKDSFGNYRYADFATQWLTALNYCNSKGALPNYISIQNEPAYTTSEQDTCLLDPFVGGNLTGNPAGALYPNAWNALYNRLATDSNKYLTKLSMIAGEPNKVNNSNNTNYPSEVHRYLQSTTGSAMVSKAGAIAFHLYGDQAWSNTTALAKIQASWPSNSGYEKFQTEYDGHEFNSKTGGSFDWIKAATTIHNTLTIANANAYLVWQLVNVGVGYGLVTPSGAVDPASLKYYSLGHYSKFIKPGYTRIKTYANSPDVLVSAYLDTTGKSTDTTPSLTPNRIVIVMINKSNNWINDIPLFLYDGATQRRWQNFATSGSSYRLTKVADYNDSVGHKVSMAPMSMNTIVIDR